MVCSISALDGMCSFSHLALLDPAIKRFALRHTYLGTDAIAARDLGFSMVRQGGSGGPGSANGSLGRSDTQLSLLSGKEPQTVPGPSMSSNKRPPSQERKREEPRSDHPPPYKRPRPLSPPPRERDRWDGPPRRVGLYGSPGWDRDRDMPPPRRSDRDEEKPTVLPNVISWFIGMLPSPGAFDGKYVPIFC
jgi:cleavage stimulation factor subunit 3